MLTQSDIDFSRFELKVQVDQGSGAPVIEPDFYAELLDMAETLLAIFDIAEPLAERKASVYLSTSDALKENHAAICKIAAYRERGGATYEHRE